MADSSFENPESLLLKLIISGLVSYDFGGKFLRGGTTTCGFLGRVPCGKSD